MSAERELDEIKVAYLEAYEVGKAPTLEDVIARYPEYRDELVDFITTAIEVEHALDWVPDPPDPANSTRRLREAAVRGARGAETLREALAGAGVSREQAAAAMNVPVTFLVRVERGRLLVDGDEPVHRAFVAGLGRILRRTADEVIEILRATSRAPALRGNTGHARGTGEPLAGERPAPQPFRALLAGCQDLTIAQRREWLSGPAGTLDGEERQR